MEITIISLLCVFWSILTIALSYIFWSFFKKLQKEKKKLNHTVYSSFEIYLKSRIFKVTKYINLNFDSHLVEASPYFLTFEEFFDEYKFFNVEHNFYNLLNSGDYSSLEFIENWNKIAKRTVKTISKFRNKKNLGKKDSEAQRISFFNLQKLEGGEKKIYLNALEIASENIHHGFLDTKSIKKKIENIYDEILKIVGKKNKPFLLTSINFKDNFLETHSKVNILENTLELFSYLFNGKDKTKVFLSNRLQLFIIDYDISSEFINDIEKFKSEKEKEIKTRFTEFLQNIGLATKNFYNWISLNNIFVEKFDDGSFQQYFSLLLLNKKISEDNDFFDINQKSSIEEKENFVKKTIDEARKILVDLQFNPLKHITSTRTYFINNNNSYVLNHKILHQDVKKIFHIAPNIFSKIIIIYIATMRKLVQSNLLKRKQIVLVLNNELIEGYLLQIYKELAKRIDFVFTIDDDSKKVNLNYFVSKKVNILYQNADITNKTYLWVKNYSKINYQIQEIFCFKEIILDLPKTKNDQTIEEQIYINNLIKMAKSNHSIVKYISK